MVFIFFIRKKILKKREDILKRFKFSIEKLIQKKNYMLYNIVES